MIFQRKKLKIRVLVDVKMEMVSVTSRAPACHIISVIIPIFQKSNNSRTQLNGNGQYHFARAPASLPARACRRPGVASRPLGLTQKDYISLTLAKLKYE